MIKSAGCFTIVLFLCLATAVPSFADSDVCATAANLLVNCGFETGNTSGWTISGDALVIRAERDDYPYSGTYALGFGNPSYRQPATVSQSFKDTAGANYTVSWALAGIATAYTWFSIDGSPVFATGPSFPYQTYAYTFTGTGNDNISFAADHSPDFGGFSFLDSVSVTPGGRRLSLQQCC